MSAFSRAAATARMRLPRAPGRTCGGGVRAGSCCEVKVMINGRSRSIRTADFDAARNEVRLIDQRLLPHEFTVIGTRDFRATSRAIGDMIVRGAGAIGATAAYGLAQGARAFRGDDVRK